MTEQMKQRSTVSKTKTTIAPSTEGVKGETPKKMAEHYNSGDYVRPEHSARWGKGTKYHRPRPDDGKTDKRMERSDSKEKSGES